MSQPFLIDVPPPTISGKLHMGHVFSYVQMDFIARFHLLKNRQLLYPFCYDNNGIPTQRLASKAGLYEPAAVVDFSDQVSVDYKHLFKSIQMGLSYTSGCYSTYSALAKMIADASFAELLDKGYVYEDERDSLWCPESATWVTQSEVDEEGRYERSGVKVEVRKQKGWFIKVVPHLDKIRDAIESITWHPEYFKDRLLKWLDGYKYDWSISRERPYGVRLLSNKLDSESRYVYDTWFISSLSPQLAWSSYTGEVTLDAPTFDVRFQAHDIINTWALYTIIESIYHNNRIPWKHIVVHGHALTGEGGKMSKTKGKVVVPSEMLDKHGPEPIRYWAGIAAPGTDTVVEQAVMDKGRKLVNKIKNAGIFIKRQQSNEENERFRNEWLAAKDFIDLQFKFHFSWASALYHLVTFFWNKFCDKFIEEAKQNPAGRTLQAIYDEMLDYFEIFFPAIRLKIADDE